MWHGDEIIDCYEVMGETDDRARFEEEYFNFLIKENLRKLRARKYLHISWKKSGTLLNCSYLWTYEGKTWSDDLNHLIYYMYKKNKPH